MAVVNTENVGLELAEAINIMLCESGDDIQSTLGKRSDSSPGSLSSFWTAWEYTALLFWITTKQAAIVLPEDSISPAIGTALGVIFSYWKNAEVSAHGDLGDDGLSLQMFQDFVWDRFRLYDWAWNGYGPAIMAEMEATAIAEGYGKEAVQQFREVNVAHNFIIMCFQDEAEYHSVFPNPKDRAAHMACIVNHYRRFAETIKTILSRYQS